MKLELAQTVILGTEQALQIAADVGSEMVPYESHKCLLHCPVCIARKYLVDDVRFQPNRLHVSVPTEEFCFIGQIIFGNTGLIDNGFYRPYGWRGIDAYEFAQIAELKPSALDGVRLTPTLYCSEKITVGGRYTGLVPVGMNAGDEFTIRWTFSQVDERARLQAVS